MGKIATVGLAPAIFGPVMNVNGSSLASWWHNHLPGERLQTTDDGPQTKIDGPQTADLSPQEQNKVLN